MSEFLVIDLGLVGLFTNSPTQISHFWWYCLVMIGYFFHYTIIFNGFYVAHTSFYRIKFARWLFYVNNTGVPPRYPSFSETLFMWTLFLLKTLLIRFYSHRGYIGLVCLYNFASWYAIILSNCLRVSSDLGF